ncbi:DUF4232 domain-containing protein [Dactylosporangium vinaceum]|uniref:DUF4232 domain-containing protein n=1 Tax=Dactylosporangium vinaceum TaxID=53362 RepID=A0ABV5ML25_9ACTN|nr:DUF4232 domain-containing protein [Dactylosporangium vinaceum]UAB99618.1 DUF4232 domain-containing protein [Dactylosporangium vinaceum]
MKKHLAALVLVPLLLAACDPVDEAAGGPSTAPGAPSSGAASSGSPVPAQSAPSSSPPQSGPSPSSQPRPTQSSGPGRCRTADLQITAQGAPGGGAAGSQYNWLVFTNISARTCTLNGYPGVSRLAGPTGPQINDPLRRETGVTVAEVVLAPNAAAHATLREANVGQFDTNCNPVDQDGFRIFPPGETTSFFLPWHERACSVNGTNVGAVFPVVAGLSETS